MPMLLTVALTWILALLPAASSPYAPAMHGSVAGFRLAGIEPDGDPLDQVVLSSTLSASGGMPRLHLIIDSYLENFQPDTTPILPDLLHPKQTAQGLGGFLQGKALLTDNAGDVLYLGSFVSEAFLDGHNNAAIALYRPNAAAGVVGTLKGVFTPHKNGSINGRLAGRLQLSRAARRQIQAHRNGPMKPLKDIIQTVSVQPHPMLGRATKGSSHVALHTGFGTPKPAQQRPSLVTVLAGIGAVFFFLVGIILYLRDRRTARLAPPSEHDRPA